MSGVTVHGGAQLSAGLAAVADGLGELDRAAAAAADLLVLDARGRAPKRTGALARSIRARVDAGGASVGTPIRYGAAVHYGVPSRGVRGRPFLTDALEANTAKVLEKYTADAQTLIDSKV